MLNKPWLFLGPVIITLLFLMILRSYLVKNAMQLSSHSWPIETKVPVLRVSKMKACWDFGDNSGAKPHVVWRRGVVVLALATLTSGKSAGIVS